MDNFLAEQNMEVSEQVNSAGAAGPVPTVIPLKRKLDRSAIVKHTGSSADSNNAGSNNDEATENKRRKSSRTSTSGTVCDFTTLVLLKLLNLETKMRDEFVILL